MTGEVIERPLATVIIPVTQIGATSEAFRVGTQATKVSVLGDDLGGGETVTIQEQDSSGNWKNYVHSFLGAFVIAGADNESSLTIYDTGIYRAVLTATANDCGVEITGRNYC
jgi:hypothetical protein